MQYNIDQSEIAKFSAIADEWWDETGKFRPLHLINPLRISFIRQQVISHFALSDDKREVFSDLRLLDIGCGGGLLSEPMRRLGADVVAIDASERNIKTASVHALQGGLEIDYRNQMVEDISEEKFDIILNLEVVEHVADAEDFIIKSANLLNDNGIMFVSTINRNLKSFMLAKVGAEYVLRWLPKGTHSWKKFVRPSELCAYCEKAELSLREMKGMNMNPLTFKWSLDDDVSVNYLCSFTRNK